MKRTTSTFAIIFISLSGIAGNLFPVDSEEIKLCGTGLSYSVHPTSLQMPLHITSPTEFLSRVLVQSYSDTTVFRKTGYFEGGASILQDGYYFAIANAISLFRLHPAGRDDLEEYYGHRDRYTSLGLKLLQ
ncbi:MAG: hypothetical protein FD137_1026 [Spirochaetes bacterium]|nr:MAG: hypothetical protein FD137_1026 [Spirochaetota bacterium]